MVIGPSSPLQRRARAGFSPASRFSPEGAPDLKCLTRTAAARNGRRSWAGHEVPTWTAERDIRRLRSLYTGRSSFQPEDRCRPCTSHQPMMSSVTDLQDGQRSHEHPLPNGGRVRQRLQRDRCNLTASGNPDVIPARFTGSRRPAEGSARKPSKGGCCNLIKELGFPIHSKAPCAAAAASRNYVCPDSITITCGRAATSTGIHNPACDSAPAKHRR